MRLELTREIKELAVAARLGQFKDAREVRDAVRTVAKSYGIGVGYIQSRMTDYIRDIDSLATP